MTCFAAGPEAAPGILPVVVDEHAEQAAYFDRWYAGTAGASHKDEIQERHLGLPPELLSTSLLTWDGIADVAEACRHRPLRSTHTVTRR